MKKIKKHNMSTESKVKPEKTVEPEKNVEPEKIVEKASKQEKIVEKASEPTQTTLVTSDMEIIREKIEEQSKTNVSVSTNIKTICEEIIELKKELESLKIIKPAKKNLQFNDVNETNEDFENSNYKDTSSDTSNDSQTADAVETSNLNKTNMEKIISNMTITEIETFLQICSNHLLIPNWYTKEDFEGLTNSKLSTKSWERILDGSEDYSSLIDETNAMAVGWFENIVAPKLNQVPLSMQSIEDSDLEDSSDDEDSDTDSDESENIKLLKNDDSDEESEQESEEDESSDNDEPIPKNMFITKQLEKLKYVQFKKIAGGTNNELTKSELVNQIAKDYRKVSILKALKFVF